MDVNDLCFMLENVQQHSQVLDIHSPVTSDENLIISITCHFWDLVLS